MLRFYSGPQDTDETEMDTCPSCGQTHQNPDSHYCTGTCQRAHEALKRIEAAKAQVRRAA